MIINQTAIPLKKGTVFFEELSFYEYKNICKMLLPNNITDINTCFETILERVKSDYKLNVIDKFEALVQIRCLTLGADLQLEIDDKKLNYPLNGACLNIFHEVEFEYDNCTFATPEYMVHNNGVVEIVADYLQTVNGNSLTHLTLKDKIAILEETNIPVIKIISIIQGLIKENHTPMLNGMVHINAFDQSAMVFLREIFMQDLMGLYEFEYQVGTALNIRGRDLTHYTLPDLKIALNFYQKEMKEREEEEKSGSQAISQ